MFPATSTLLKDPIIIAPLMLQWYSIEMKKLLSIIVLGFLLGGNAYAKIIEFKNCYRSDTTFEESLRDFKEHFIEIDTKNKTVNRTRIATQKRINEMNKLGDPEKEVTIKNYNIKSINKKFIETEPIIFYVFGTPLKQSLLIYLKEEKWKLRIGGQDTDFFYLCEKKGFFN
jgi:hypothetical protein